ncbi:MAG: hypothetical protein WCX28_05985 [Bacteriovoracaceae bacterium]
MAECISSDPSTERFVISITVVPDEIIVMVHVNNIVHLRRLQEAASAISDEQQLVAWVILRHEIDNLFSSRIGDDIIIRARTLRCPIDLRNGRPMRAGKFLFLIYQFV